MAKLKTKLNGSLNGPIKYSLKLDILELTFLYNLLGFHVSGTGNLKNINDIIFAVIDEEIGNSNLPFDGAINGCVITTPNTPHE